MAQLTDEQRTALNGRLHDLINDITPLIRTSKEMLRIIEQIYKLKYRCEHEAQLSEIAPKTLNRKELKAEMEALIQ